MNNIPSISTRTIAFLIDYILFIVYVSSLALFSIQVNSITPFWEYLENSIIIRHSISLITVTIPFVLYFSICESKYKATWGKKRMKLKVVNGMGLTTSFKQALLRNILKFMPWELAHIVLNLYFPLLRKDQAPIWVILLLYLPMIIALFYFIVAIRRKDNRSVYELISNTKVVS